MPNRKREAGPDGRRKAARELAQFLLGAGEPPALEVLTGTRTAAFAYTVLGRDHPLGEALRPAYLSALTRHHRMVEALVPLVGGWCEAGVDALVFKGFHVAEFVYPRPGMRFHGDVDVCVRPEHEDRAVGVARELGWIVENHIPPRGLTATHGVANLIFPDSSTRIDLQRTVVHRQLEAIRAPEAVTDAVWRACHRQEWNGAVLRLPAPVDAMLILALQRVWNGSDRGRIKPHDLLDMRFLAEDRPGWRTLLEVRAAKVGALGSVRFFLDRCDPDRGRFELVPSGGGWLSWALTVVRDRPLLPVERPLYRSTRALPTLLDVIRVTPDLVRAWWALRRGGPIPEVLGAVEPDVPEGRPRTSRESLRRTVRGARWALRLWPGGPGTCLVRSLALFSALRRQGWPVELVTGVRRDSEAVTGHAWLELEGRVLPELNDDLAPRFEPGVRYPTPLPREAEATGS